MDFEHLKIFISVVDQGSFTKAAETMYISHSTTSRNVAALEDSLGVRLLERCTRGLKLTEAGTLLYREGKLLLDRLEELENEVRTAANSEKGKLSVASVYMFSAELNDFYASFCSKHPDIVFGIYHHELSEVLSLVGKGEADLGVTFSYALPKNAEDFEFRSVAAEEFCAVCAQNHPLAAKSSVRARELRNLNYVGVGEQRSGFSKRLEEEIFADRTAGETLSVPTLESLFLQVRNGNGISLVPYPMAREFGKNCALLDIEDVVTRFDIVVFWRKDNDNPALRHLSSLIDERQNAETAF